MRLIPKYVAFRHSSNVSAVNMLNGIYQNKFKIVCRVESKTDVTADTVGPIQNNIRELNFSLKSTPTSRHASTSNAIPTLVRTIARTFN